jgi:hypothetical protein
MQCYIHGQQQAIGACVGCGKFICTECTTEISGKNYCKACVSELVTKKEKEIDKLESKTANPQQPMVFMNAGGGSSSSSSSSAAAAAGGMRGGMPFPRQSIMIHILLLMFTAGIGNVVYFLYIRNQQNRWYSMH